MAIPEQLRKQTEAVQELYKQMEESTGNEEATGDQADSEQEQLPADSNVQSVQQPATEKEQKVDEPKSEEDYVQKYKTLQGMYNAEVPRLHSQNRDLTNRVQQLEQLLASMNSQPAKKDEPTQEKYVTDSDIEEYGDSIDMMRKVTREELSAAARKIAQLENTINKLNSSVVPQMQQVVQRQAASSEQQFWSDLTAVVPDWRDINDSADFQAWLLQVDPLTGINRQTYLEDAQQNLDSRRVASFFETWQGMSGNQSVAQNKNVTNSELEKQVAPGRAKSGGAPTNNSAKMYTPEDIKKFFEDVRKGKYVGKEAERDRIESDIFSAQREGRLQNS